MLLENDIQVQTNQFDGPLGLLLMLIQKDELKIQDLDITVITKQYLDYLVQMRELNFDVAGDYLYLAATLLHLKSQSCLGEDETLPLDELDMNGPAITTRAELIRRLEELQKFQLLGQKLWALPKRGHELFVRPKISRNSIVNSILVPSDLSKLTLAMIDFIKKEKKKYTAVKRDRYSIKEKLVQLKDKLKLGESYTLSDVLVTADDIKELVITFISLLELARLRKIQLFQNEKNAAVYFQIMEDLSKFNVDLADGFDAEDEAPAPAEEEMVIEGILEEPADLELEIEQDESMESSELDLDLDNNKNNPKLIQ